MRPRSLGGHPQTPGRRGRGWTLAFTSMVAMLVHAPACTQGAIVRGRIGGLTQDVENAEKNGAIRCAPRELALAKSHLRFAEVKLDQVQIHIPAGPRLGDLVIEATDLRKGFGERLLIEDLSFSLPRGGIVGVIGPNGAGKTTLFRMITGQEQPDGGALRIGDTVVLAYVDQSRDSLDDSRSVWEEISDSVDQIKVGDRWVNSRQYTASFNFRGSDQQKKVAKLSGGERNRLHLAKLLRGGGNLLLLDEPTNDLDVDTLRALEEALLSFAGCAVVISHDRWFLDRVATHILAFEGNSEVTWFEGDWAEYADWVREKEKAAAAKAAAAARAEAPAPAARARAVRKLTNKERGELEKLPGQIEAIEASQAQLGAKLSDPVFYQRERGAASEVKSLLDELDRKHAVAFARWEELEALRAGG